MIQGSNEVKISNKICGFRFSELMYGNFKYFGKGDENRDSSVIVHQGSLSFFFFLFFFFEKGEQRQIASRGQGKFAFIR
jgi:hypothetical protein